MFTNNIITQQVYISPSEMNVDIDSTLLKKIQDKIGDKCIKYGFVEKSSIKIIKRSLGILLTNYLNGDINYIVKFSANICNPPENLLVNATVKNVNKMGLLLEKGPLSIVVARQLHKDKSQFTNSNFNKNLSIVIKGSKFDLNANKIICLGVLYDDSLKDKIISHIDNSVANEIELDDDTIDTENDNELDIVGGDQNDIISEEDDDNESESDESLDNSDEIDEDETLSEEAD